MPEVPKVALLIETANSYGRGLLRGVRAYLRENKPWSIYLPEQGWGRNPGMDLSVWQGDGLIVRIETPMIAQSLEHIKLPMVDVSSARLRPELPWFENDYKAIAQMAFNHFSERGFKRFAFCGVPRYNWSIWMGQHYKQIVRDAGYSYFEHEPVAHLPFGDETELASIKEWLVNLPKPIALLASNDYRGRLVLHACRQCKIAVPDEIAVLGEDNDEVYCELSDPPLSSIAQNSKRIGYEAAACLDRIMKGEPVDNTGVFIPPIGVVTRQSTDVLAVEDRSVAQVVRYIREHATEGINVKDVLRACPQSRRLMETRFIKELGHSPHEEIINVRLTKVKNLLVESDLSMEAIAERCGFTHVEYLSVAFKRKVGVPPSVYRLKNKS